MSSQGNAAASTGRVAQYKQWYLIRPNGTMIPLVPIDEFPVNIKILEFDRSGLVPEETEGMISLGLVAHRGEMYTMRESTINMIARDFRENGPHTPRTGYTPGLGYDAHPSRDFSALPPGPGSARPLAGNPQSKREGSYMPVSLPYSALCNQFILYLRTNLFLPQPNVRGASVATTLAPDNHYVRDQPMTADAIFTTGVKRYCSHWCRTGECDYMQQGCKYYHIMPQTADGLQAVGLRKIPQWYIDQQRDEEWKKRQNNEPSLFDSLKTADRDGTAVSHMHSDLFSPEANNHSKGPQNFGAAAVSPGIAREQSLSNIMNSEKEAPLTAEQAEAFNAALSGNSPARRSYSDDSARSNDRAPRNSAVYSGPMAPPPRKRFNNQTTPPFHRQGNGHSRRGSNYDGSTPRNASRRNSKSRGEGSASDARPRNPGYDAKNKSTKADAKAIGMSRGRPDIHPSKRNSLFDDKLREQAFAVFNEAGNRDQRRQGSKNRGSGSTKGGNDNNKRSAGHASSKNVDMEDGEVTSSQSTTAGGESDDGNRHGTGSVQHPRLFEHQGKNNGKGNGA